MEAQTQEGLMERHEKVGRVILKNQILKKKRPELI
jgi:hypothetical protein